MSAPFALDREALARLPKTRLGRTSRFKPQVWRVETPAGPVVVKDVHHAGLATRWIARWLLARERRVLERLGSIDAVPRLLAAPGSDAIVLSIVPGLPLDRTNFRERPREIVDQLRELSERLHELGVFHLDLHQRKNLLVDAEGRLRLVDFGSAVAPGRLIRFLAGPLLRYSDRQAALKFLARFAPEELSEAEARAVVRHRRIRRLWPFAPHSERELRHARARLR